MSTHRFAIGEIVCFRNHSPVKLPESFEIIARLPQRDGVFQYRIKSALEQYERVVQEDDIEPIHDVRPANSNLPAHLRG